MGNSKNTVVTVRQVPADLWRRFKKQAIDEGRPVQYLAIEAFEHYLKGSK